MKNSLLSCALLATAGVAQIPAPAVNLPPAGGWPFEQVLHDEPGDGRLWACGATWKASFGRDGFTYVPALGKAQRSLPLRLRIAAVRAGGQALPFDANAAPRRDGDRVTFDRGGVDEVYDLRLHEVEQTFVIDTALAGDLEVELAVESELSEDAAAPGIQFASADGGVNYGDAFVVRGSDKLAIDSAFAGSTIRLRVPASLRGDGPVVIDPILSTQAATLPSVTKSPDVAYDASTHRYLFVWEIEFSEFDHDVFTVMFDAQGNLIPGSHAPIDISTLYFEHPRVANLNQADRFLVVTAMIDPGNGHRQMIYGRMRDAGGTTTLHQPVLLSDPALPGNNYLPEVGADPATGAGNHDWLVVWANHQSGTQADIQGRLVLGTGQPRSPSVLPIHSGVNQHNWDVQVSRSNGNGIIPAPMWWVVYGRSTAQTAGDIFGRSVDPNGLVGSERQFANSVDDDKRPHVSSPAFLPSGQTGFIVAFERPGMAVGQVVRTTTSGSLITQTWDLTTTFGAGRYTPRVDSDGLRFAFTSSAVIQNTSLEGYTHARTFAYSGSTLLQQDSGNSVPGFVTETRIVAHAASGGLVGGYAIAYLKHENGFKRPMLTRYAGQTPGEETNVLPTACGGLGIAATGTTAIGGALTFTLSSFGADIPAFGFGGANLNAVPICSGCALGLRIDMPIEILIGDTMSIAIPRVLGLVGETFAVQGLGIGGGSCFGSLRFADTIRFTIR